jgi:hypothetical protein
MPVDETDDAAVLFDRLVGAVAEEYELNYHEAMGFIRESCKAGGLPDPGEEPELVEELRQAARHEVDISWLTGGSGRD